MTAFISKITVVSAALLAAAGIGIGTAGPAAASPVPGADASCTETWEDGGTPGIGGGTWVEWTANTCGHLIQERTWCVFSPTGVAGWETSGVVKQVFLIDSSGCGPRGEPTRGEVRFSSDGGSSWSKYATFITL